MAASESTGGSQQQKFELPSAIYQSPTNEAFSHTTKLPAPSSTKTTDRTSYLAALRKATAEMQETINKELTSRMEEDKAREAAANGISKAKVVDEAKEEDNYGEEVVEEED
jgi:Gon7 family